MSFPFCSTFSTHSRFRRALMFSLLILIMFLTFIYSKTSPFSQPRKAGEVIARGYCEMEYKSMLKGGGTIDTLTPKDNQKL